jgi:hypothetical protein
MKTQSFETDWNVGVAKQSIKRRANSIRGGFLPKRKNQRRMVTEKSPYSEEIGDESAISTG